MKIFQILIFCSFSKIGIEKQNYVCNFMRPEFDYSLYLRVGSGFYGGSDPDQNPELWLRGFHAWSGRGGRSPPHPPPGSPTHTSTSLVCHVSGSLGRDYSVIVYYIRYETIKQE